MAVLFNSCIGKSVGLVTQGHANCASFQMTSRADRPLIGGAASDLLHGAAESLGLNSLLHGVHNAFSAHEIDPPMPKEASSKFKNQGAEDASESLEDEFNVKWGFITGFSVSFKEAPPPENEPISSGTSMMRGVLTMNGVAFKNVCSDDGSKRSGMEALLYFYYYNRISNTDTIHYTRITVGKSAFPHCWLIGMDIHHDPDTNVHPWSLTFTIDPAYRVKNLRGNDYKAFGSVEDEGSLGRELLSGATFGIFG